MWNSTEGGRKLSTLEEEERNSKKLNSYSLKREMLSLIPSICTFKIDFKVSPAESVKDMGEDIIGLNGYIYSENCVDFAALNVTVAARIADDRILSEASSCAMALIFISLVQISLLARQLQTRDSQVLN